MSEPQLLYHSDPTGEHPSRFVVMQYAPMQVSVSLKDTEEMFSLWTPWLVSVVRMNSLAMNLFARPSPLALAGADDVLYALGWPHVDGGGGVCYAPRDFLGMYSCEAATPLGQDRLTAIACMQIFLGGNSSYFICGPKALPSEFRHLHAASEPPPPPPGTVLDAVDPDVVRIRPQDRVEAFFRAWEALDEAQVLALDYTAYAHCAELITYKAEQSLGQVYAERAALQHLEGGY